MMLKSINKPVRAGIIPFTVAFGQVYFLMGIDSVTCELSDFGGGIKNYETPIQAALREFQEETCGIFGDTVTLTHLQRSKFVKNYKSNAFIFFVLVPVKWLYIAEEQFSKIKIKGELCGVKWLSDLEFKNYIFNKRSQVVWKRVKNILANTSWVELVDLIL